MCFADKILVTTFRQCVIPPPMCAFELQLPVPVNLVTFHSQAQRTNELAALTADGHIYVYGEGESHSNLKLLSEFKTSISYYVGFIHLCFLYSGGGVENGGVPRVLGFKVISAPLVLRKKYRYMMILSFSNLYLTRRCL